MAGILVAALSFAGVLEPLDRALLELRYELLPRQAEQGLAVVEIDARSLRELETWPWPRAYHATLIERLLDAGATQIAIDVDFSSRSTPADDQALSRAVARADGRIILPAFVQGAQALSPSATYENAPHASLRTGARLGVANVRVEADGLVWRYPVAEEQPGGFRPSLATRLADTGHFRFPDFAVDFGIRADTLTRLSYVDVLRGRVDPGLLAGRNVLVGSTAAELGDHIAVPIYRAIPGVLLHALAYESIVQNRMIQRTGIAVTLIGIAVLLLAFAPFTGTDEHSWWRALAFAMAAIVAIAAATLAVQSSYPLSIDSAAWIAAIAAMFLASVIRRLHEQAILLFRQRMAQTHGRAMMRSVVEDSFDGIIIVDQSGRVELANRSALRILGRSTSPVGLPVGEVLPGVSDRPAGPVEASPKREIEVRREDGSTVSLDVVASASELQVSRRRYERRKRARRVRIYTFRDITERRQMIASQRKALDAAVSANRAKSEFLANMSHELRTPLNAIIGFSEAILAGIFGPIGNPRYKEYVHDIHTSGEHLLAIIQQVLDVSRIEAGTLTLNEEVILLPDILKECELIIRGWLVKTPRQLSLNTAPDLPPIVADPTLVKQILLNLMSNAVKFTSETGRIDVRIYIDGEGRPAIDVTDDGIGISEEHVQKLGQPFFQVNASASGTGLGLHLVRQFAALHGGKLEFVTHAGRGTLARVTFPRTRIATAATPPGQNPSGDGGGRILQLPTQSRQADRSMLDQLRALGQTAAPLSRRVC